MSNDFNMSKSRMGLYHQCPYSYKLRYIEKIPQPTNIYFEIGTDVHDFIDNLFKIVKIDENNVLTIPNIDLDTNSEYKFNVLDFEHSRWTTIKDMGLDDSYFFPVECETTFYDKENKITGIVDRVHKCHNQDELAPKHRDFMKGDLVIVENKTGKFSPYKAHSYEEELLWYRHLLKVNKGIDVRWGCIYFPHSNTCRHIDLDSVKLTIPKLLQSVNTTRQAIISEEFTPKPSTKNCRWCSYKDYCEYKILN